MQKKNKYFEKNTKIQIIFHPHKFFVPQNNIFQQSLLGFFEKICEKYVFPVEGLFEKNSDFGVPGSQSSAPSGLRWSLRSMGACIPISCLVFWKVGVSSLRLRA